MTSTTAVLSPASPAVVVVKTVAVDDETASLAAGAAGAAPSLRPLSTIGSTTSMVDNRMPITLTWRNLNYEVALPQPGFFARRRLAKANAANGAAAADASPANAASSVNAASPAVPITSKRILTDVSGLVRPGQLMAIMGSSGAGKTTLLNCLSGRNRDFTGDVLVNGKPLSKSLGKHTAFVQQSDLFFRVLTVREHLTFQAKMRMTGSTAAQREARVQQVIHELGLTKIADSRIGEVGLGGISGGERRRLSFATEVLNDPSLLFVDEPTSGLDSFMADEVVSILRDLANMGRTIVCTIHQPSADVYARFDSVCYMANGRVAYIGALDGAREYFGALGHPCPAFQSPADFIIRLLSIQPSALEASQRAVVQFLDQFAVSNAKAEIDHEIDVALNRGAGAETAKSTNALVDANADRNQYAVGWTTQMSALARRAMLTIVRDPMLTKARFGQSVFLSLIVGLIYLRLGNNQNSVQNKMGAIFFMLVNQCMGGIVGVLNTFPAELPIFQREYKARMYSSHAYFLSRSMIEMPFQMLFPAIFCAIAYWMVGLRDDFPSFIYFTLIIILTANSAMSLGILISCLAPTVSVALAISMPIIMPLMLFGGLFINVNSIPPYFYWISYLSFFQYGYEILGVIVWRDTTIQCEPGTKDYCFGSEVLSRYSMSESNVGRDIGVLFALAVGFRSLAYLFLYRRANKAF